MQLILLILLLTQQPKPVEPPRHANRAYVACVVTRVGKKFATATCHGKRERFPLTPDWRWTLPKTVGTQFYYEQGVGDCRVVHAVDSHAIVFDERRAAPNCDQ